MMGYVTIIIIGVVVFAVVSVLGSKYRERYIEKLFAGRAPLSEDEFYERYFAADGIPKFVVLGVKRVFERELDVDFSRLRPDDDFSSNLNFFWREDNLADVDVLEGFEKEFYIKLTQEDASRMTTFSSFVQVVWEKMRQEKQ